MDATTAASSPSINARLRWGTSKASARGASAANQERQDRKAGATLDDVKGAISGHLCRCGTYPNIFKAMLAVAGTAAKAKAGG